MKVIGPCIEATGWRDRDGYIRQQRDHRRQAAHRWAWEDAFGPIPQGLIVRHVCDNPACINVDHLLLGTQKDNIHDMHARGRDVGRRGHRHTECKNGHPFDETNTHFQRDGKYVYQRCRTCAREQMRRHRARLWH